MNFDYLQAHGDLKVLYKDIYDNMPNRLDRLKLLHMLKKHQRHRLKEKSKNEGK